MMYKIGIEGVMENMKRVDPLYFALAFVFSAGAIVVKMIRWSTLFTEINTVAAWKIYLIGQAINQVAPTGSGELTRAYVAKSEFDIPVGSVLAPAAVERISDTTFLLSMAIFLLAAVMDTNLYYYQVIFLSSLLLGIGYYFVLKPEIFDKLAMSFERFLESKIENFLNIFTTKISHTLRKFKESLIRFKENRKTIAKTIIFTIISWIVYGFGFYALILGMDKDIGRFCLFYSIVLIAASEIIGSFSFLPGGLGAKEASITFFLSVIFSVSLTEGFALSLLWRFITYLQIGGGSLISMISLANRHKEEN